MLTLSQNILFFSQPISHFLLQGTELQQRLAIHVQMRRRPRVTCEESGPIFGEDEAGPGEQRGELGDQHLWRREVIVGRCGKSGMRMFRISMFFYNDGFLILMMFWYGKTSLFAAFISSLPIFGDHFFWRAAKTPLFSIVFHGFPLFKRRLSIAIHAIAKQAQGFRGGHRFSEINLLNDLISSKGSTWSTAIFALNQQIWSIFF